MNFLFYSVINATQADIKVDYERVLNFSLLHASEAYLNPGFNLLNPIKIITRG